MSKPRLLDLFAGAGGSAVGYARAGFEVVGVDIKPQPRYPFEFHQADAMTYPLEGFDAIHASPPCQRYSITRHLHNNREHLDLVAAIRWRLQMYGAPFVIENVQGAPLFSPVMLCGTMFGLGADGRQLRRHRLFETNFPLLTPPCVHSGPVIGVYGTGGGGPMTRGFKARSREEAGVALGTPWMTKAECAQAIPPAYTEYVGHQLMALLAGKESAA